ncbi:hypothetical protein [Streptomyces sp. KL116D]|uniref:hypothetical protein n=1 Tax=Streptomyces sp. KL116D TaxID=3045152 RepID=UPI00355851E3
MFIPGDAITMAMIELSVGRITAGAARLAQSVALLGALAFGPVLASAALGMPQSEIPDSPVAPDLGWVAAWLGWVVFTVGVLLVFGMRRGDLPGRWPSSWSRTASNCSPYALCPHSPEPSSQPP